MSLTRSVAGVAVARGLGLAAALAFTVYVAHRLGSDRSTDIAFNALIFPQTLSVLIGTLLPSVFVTVFKGVEVKKGIGEAWAFGRSSPRVAGLVAAGAALAGAAASPLLARAIGSGFTPAEVARMSGFMQAAFLLLVVTAVGSVIKGLLNASGSFFVPSLDTVAMNAAAIATIAFTAQRWGAFSLVAGIVAGGLAKILIMMPGYLRRRLPGPTPLIHPALREAGAMLVPVILTGALYAVGAAIMRALASTLPGEGAVSHLTYAEKIFSAPADLFVVSIGSVILPSMARDAAAGDLEELRRRLTVGLRMAALFGIPAAVGLALLAEPLTGLLYQRGRFDAADTIETARALRGYAGALAFSGHALLYQAFYALGRTRAILASAATMMAVTVTAGALLLRPLGVAGLSLAWSIAYAAGFGVSLVLFCRAAGKPDLQGILSGALRVSLCSAAMGGAVWAMGSLPVLARVGAGAAVFALLARFLCPEEWKAARKLWSRADTGRGG